MFVTFEPHGKRCLILLRSNENGDMAKIWCDKSAIYDLQNALEHALQHLEVPPLEP